MIEALLEAVHCVDPLFSSSLFVRLLSQCLLLVYVLHSVVKGLARSMAERCMNILLLCCVFASRV